MIRPFFLWLVHTCLSFGAFAQSVDLVTGRLEMSLPIGQLSVNDIQIPISLYHHGMSLMVAEGEGDCGVGWNINTNSFAITREVRGIHDEVNTTTRKGWLHNNNGNTVQGFSPSADDNLASCADEVSDYNFLNNLVGSYQNDTEPDLFTINAPGLSGQFVFGADGLPKWLVHQDVSVQYYADSIVVKTSRGMVYRFRPMKKVYRKGFLPQTITDINTEAQYYASTGPNPAWPYEAYNEVTIDWKLDLIKSLTTWTSASFTYVNSATEAGKRYYSLDSTHYTRDVTFAGKDIQTITLKSYTATFIWSNKLLQRIVIEETNTHDKQEFEMEYLNADYFNQYHYLKHFLKKLRYLGGQCQPYQTYLFNYENENDLSLGSGFQTYVNWKKNWGQDFFGYLNGVAANKNTPTIYLYDGQTASRRLRTSTITGLTPTETVSGDSRTPAAVNIYGALKRVTYPTGGYTEIEWEPNQYIDVTTSEQMNGGGARVKKISTSGSEVAFGKDMASTNSFRTIVKQYEYYQPGGTASSGLIVAPPKLGYITTGGIRRVVNNLGERPMIYYSHVREKVSGQGSTLYQFNVPGTFPEITNAEWKATKSRIARASGASCSFGYVKNDYFQFPYAPSSNFDYRRGQLAKVTEYNEAGTIVREKSYTYTPKTSSPTTIKAIRFEKIGGVYYYGVYEILTGRMDVISQEVYKEASHVDLNQILQTTVNYTYNAYHALRSVTTTFPDNTVATKTTKYARDYVFLTPTATDTAAVAIKALNDLSRGTEPIEVINSVTLPGLTATVTGAELIVYRNFGANRVLPYYIKQFPTGAAFTESAGDGANFYSDSDYITKRVVKEYDAEGRVLTERDHRKNYAAKHYLLDISTPSATIMNAKAQQAVSEGFEMTSSFGLSAVGSDFLYPSGWTGEKCAQFRSNTSTLVSSASKPIQKNGNLYRVSCWVYSISGKTITFNVKSGGVTEASVQLTNSVNNKWNYLEGEVNVVWLPASFTIEIITNASVSEPVSVDDIVFIPVNARISSQTVLPLKGVTSASDDGGNSVKTTYDGFGRPVNSLDQNRNLLQRKEYVVYNMSSPKPYASFYASTDVYFINTAVTFTPTDNGPNACETGVVYQWEVDGVPMSSSPGNVLNHTFTTPGPKRVTLTATAPSGATQSTSQNICVEYQYTGSPGTYVADIGGSPLGTTMDCNAAIRYVSITGPAPPPGCSMSISWTRDGVPYGSGDLVVPAMAVSGTEPVIVHYEATVVMECSAYKECFTTSPLGYSGTVSVYFTHLPGNCN